MNISNEWIKSMARITESQINEVSDVDVDWDNETLDKMDANNAMEAEDSFLKLNDDDRSYALNILLGIAIKEKHELDSWLDYWDKHGSSHQNVVDWIKNEMKFKSGISRTYEINKAKFEEGI